MDTAQNQPTMAQVLFTKLAVDAIQLRMLGGVCPYCQVAIMGKVEHHPKCALQGAEDDIRAALP
jgi:hypothetical protein